MKDFIGAQAAIGRRIAGHGTANLTLQDTRFIGWAGVLLPSVWPCLTAEEKTDTSDVLEGLELAHTLNTQRNAALLAQLQEVAPCLNAMGVEPVLLKGIAHLSTKLWPTAGARLLGDIDLLVPADAVAPAFDALDELADLGTQESGNPELTDREKHALPVQGAGGVAPVELHHSLYRLSLRGVAPAADIIAAATPIQVGKGQAKVPSPTDQVLIAALHGPFSGGYLEPLAQMRDLLDIVFLQARHGDAIDWTRIEDTLVRHNKASIVEITRRCLIEFTGFEPPFGVMPKSARLDAARWRWQLERSWARRLGAFANLSQEAVRSLAAGGAPRYRALGYLGQTETYKRAWRRYIRGEAR